jgi:hypothetical protein
VVLAAGLAASPRSARQVPSRNHPALFRQAAPGPVTHQENCDIRLTWENVAAEIRKSAAQAIH